MLGIIGLGQGGSNLSMEVGKYGVLNGAINYSLKDLESVDVKHKLRLLGSEGVGKNRLEAIALFQDQWETAINFIRDNFSNCKLIVFAFSSSGGSGSGIAPILIDVASQMFPDKVFIAFVVLPEINEAETSQLNCLSTFEELSSLGIAVFPVDNQQIRNQNILAGKNKIYEIANSEAISLLCKLVEYTNKHSKNGNFDEKDLLTALKTGGIATIAETPLSTSLQNMNLTLEGVRDKVIQSWSESVFSPVTSRKISKAAFVFDGQESLMDFIRTDAIFDSFHSHPSDLFEGYYHQHNGKLLTLLTGLDWSFKRLKDIEKSLEIKQINNKSDISTGDIGYKASINIKRPTHTRKPESKVSVMDILSKYNR